MKHIKRYNESKEEYNVDDYVKYVIPGDTRVTVGKIISSFKPLNTWIAYRILSLYDGDHYVNEKYIKRKLTKSEITKFELRLDSIKYNL